VGLPGAEARRTAFTGRGVPGALARLTLIVLMPLPVLAEEVAGAWRTQTIPQEAAPAPVVQGTAVVPPRAPTLLEQEAAETIKITNEFRRRNGLPPFAEDPVCTAAAFDHAEDMARRGYFDHFAPDGSSPTVRYQRRNTAGQRVIRVTENIARGNGTTPESALRMWLNSSGHRKHLVGTEMNHIGVGVANGSCFFSACTYFVQCFSRWP
jgi:uncharacterized protein YkwD